MVSKDTVTGVAMDTCTSDLGLVPSVAGFFRRMLGRGEEPWAGVLVLAL